MEIEQRDQKGKIKAMNAERGKRRKGMEIVERESVKK